MRRDENNGSNETKLSILKILVDKAIKRLKTTKGFPFENSERLVEITQELPLWNFYFGKAKKVYHPSVSELDLEVNSFFTK